MHRDAITVCNDCLWYNERYRLEIVVGLKSPSVDIELWHCFLGFRSRSSALPFLSFPTRGFVLLFLWNAASSSVRESLQLASCKSFDCARIKRVPIIRRVRAQTVEGICSRVSRPRDDVLSFGIYPRNWRARNRDISLDEFQIVKSR